MGNEDSLAINSRLDVILTESKRSLQEAGSYIEFQSSECSPKEPDSENKDQAGHQPGSLQGPEKSGVENGSIPDDA